MLDLIKENLIFVYNEHHENIAYNYVSIYGVLQEFSQYSLQCSYIQHTMSASLEMVDIDIYNRDKKVVPTLMLVLLFLYFCLGILLSKEEHPAFNIS